MLDEMFITIITPVSRPENLFAVSKSLFENNEQYMPKFRWLFSIDSETPVDFKLWSNMFNTYWDYYPSRDRGISGNAQRNHLLSLANKTNPFAYGRRDWDHHYLYFLDDDTILHPNFFKRIFEIHEGYEAIMFDVIRKDGSMYTPAGPDNVRLNHCDTANIVLPSYMAAGNIWTPGRRDADGLFFHAAKEKWNAPDEWKFVNEPLGYYNYLRP